MRWSNEDFLFFSSQQVRGVPSGGGPANGGPVRAPHRGGGGGAAPLAFWPSALCAGVLSAGTYVS